MQPAISDKTVVAVRKDFFMSEFIIAVNKPFSDRKISAERFYPKISKAFHAQ
jgi:hypothetical protein